MTVWAIASNVFKDAIRKKVVYIIFLFTLFLIGLTPALPSFELGVRITLFKDIALGFSSLFGLILALVFAINNIPTEVERRTIYNLLSKKVNRIQFVAGKYLGILTIVYTIEAIFAIEIILLLYLKFSLFDLSILKALWSLTLEISLVTAFTLMLSTAISPFINFFLTILFYFTGHIKNSFLDIIGQDGLSGPLEIIVSIIKYIFPSLSYFNINGAIAHDAFVPPNYLLAATGTALVYILIFIFLGMVIFSRRDL